MAETKKSDAKPAAKPTEAKTAAKKTAKKAAAGTKYEGFSAEERAAMKERAQEIKASSRKGPGAQAKAEAEVVAKIAEMAPADREIAERLHAIIKATAPELTAKLWYGMPSYARDGKTICFFQDAEKFKARYSTLGFSDQSNLDDSAFFPTSFGLKKLTDTEEKKIVALLKKALS